MKYKFYQACDELMLSYSYIQETDNITIMIPRFLMHITVKCKNLDDKSPGKLKDYIRALQSNKSADEVYFLEQRLKNEERIPF